MEEREIFLEAIELADPEVRNAFLEKECAGNSSLFNRLKDLLAMHKGAGDFLKTPAIDQIFLAESAIQPESEPIDGGQVSRSNGKASDKSDESFGEMSLSFLQPSTHPDSLGRLGNYEVLQIIGRGAFGVVLKAFDEKLKRMVAIKVIAPNLLSASMSRARFLREAQAFAAVRHPNIVHVYAIEEQPVPYLVMEYVPSETIQEQIEERGAMSVREVLQIGEQIASGLAAAHAVGLIHRDIKPANILLEEGGSDRVRITDFGLARALEGENLTQTDVIAGTPMYMSPEQVLGEPLDQRTDLFSLGSVLYLMISGHCPFRTTTTAGLLKRVADEAPLPIQQFAPNAPEWLCKIIGKLHAKKPDDRFGSAREVADLLNRCLIDFNRGQTPQLVSLPAQTASASRSIRKLPWLIAGIGAALVLALSMFPLKPREMTQRPDPSSVKTESSTPTTEAIEQPAKASENLVSSMELGPRINPKSMGDGSFSDLSFRDGVLSLDATSGSRQLWVNFPDVEGEEMTIQTEFRVTRPTNFGMGKFIFMPDQGKQAAATIVFGPKGFEMYIEMAGESFPRSERIRFPGGAVNDWNELSFVISADKYSFNLNGNVVLERPRELQCSGYFAIACISSICEMKDLRVVQSKTPPTAELR